MQFIIQQVWASFNWSQKNAVFYRLCFKERHQAEEGPVALLQLQPMLLQQHENNKGNLRYKRVGYHFGDGIHIIKAQSNLPTVLNKANSWQQRQ